MNKNQKRKKNRQNKIIGILVLLFFYFFFSKVIAQENIPLLPSIDSSIKNIINWLTGTVARYLGGITFIVLSIMCFLKKLQWIWLICCAIGLLIIIQHKNIINIISYIFGGG